MLTALSAAALSVALGVLLALVPAVGSNAIGRVRTFALLSAVTVVALDLFPESVRALGASAIGVLAAALIVPAWIERWIIGHGHEAHAHGAQGIALEVGYVGLILHHLGDGVALYTYGANATPHGGVILALGAHTVPLVAVVVLQYSVRQGRRAGIIRAAGLLLAMLAGTAVAGLVPAGLVESASPWIAALVSGLLLHVIVHDLGADPPRAPWARALDLLSAILGAAVPLWGGSAVDREVLLAFGDRLSAFAPAVLAGLFALALVVPRVLHGPGLFALAVPALSLDALLAASSAAGSKFGMSWLVGASLVGVAGGLWLMRGRIGGTPSFETTMLSRFDARFRQVVPWMLAGCLVASCIGVAVPQAEVRALRAPSLALVAATLILVPAGVAPAAMMPIAGALLLGGASWGGVLAATIIAAVAAIPRLREAATLHGWRRTTFAGVSAVAAAWILGAAIDAYLPAIEPAPLRLPEQAELFAAGVLGVLFLRAIWPRGIRGFISSPR